MLKLSSNKIKLTETLLSPITQVANERNQFQMSSLATRTILVRMLYNGAVEKNTTTHRQCGHCTRKPLKQINELQQAIVT